MNVGEKNMEGVVTESTKGAEAEANEENTEIGTREKVVVSESNEENVEPNINEDDNIEA
jgi:hypothetical protein